MAIVMNTKFAEWVDRILLEHGIKTLRQAEPRTGISHSTIKNMKEGRVPEEPAIIRFAASFGEDVATALRLAGYDEMADIWEGQHNVPDAGLITVRENPIDYNSDPDVGEEEGEVLRYFQGIPPMMRPAAKAMLKGLMDAEPDYEEGRVFGRKAE
jgi:hypothetical protein